MILQQKLQKILPEEESLPAPDWPLSQDELKAAKETVISSLSFSEVMEKYSSKIEELLSSTFTHRCICPNKKHKNGMERTPSFYFSEHDKRFTCFGCTLSGDIFDLIALMEGMPWYQVVRDIIKDSKLNIAKLDIESVKVDFKAFANSLFETNLHLSVALREYLKLHHGKDYYKKEALWVESIFKKIDLHLERINAGDGEALLGFKMQTLMELERRKLKFPNLKKEE